MERRNFILAIVLSSFTVMAACSGCAILTVTGGAVGFHLSKSAKSSSDVNSKGNQPSKGDESKKSKKSKESETSESSKTAGETFESLEKVITVFHSKFNQDDFEGMYNLFGENFREQISKESFINLFTGFKERLGDVKTFSSSKVKIGEQYSIKTLTFLYEGVYENETVDEEFGFALINGEFILYRFNVKIDEKQNNMQMEDF